MNQPPSHSNADGPEWPRRDDHPAENSSDPKWKERRRDCWLRRAKRCFLAMLIDGSIVSTDDVRRLVPVPEHINPSIVGDVPTGFHRDGIIERVGDFHTERPIAHRRFLSLWMIKDIDAANKWLEIHPEFPPDDGDGGSLIRTDPRSPKAGPQKTLFQSPVEGSVL